jgi:ABC transporter substrate binding protein (PQQ-dependent alcohol dehydrogenase system)
MRPYLPNPNPRWLCRGLAILLLLGSGFGAAAAKAPTKAAPRNPTTAGGTAKPAAGNTIALAYLTQVQANLPVRPFFDPTPAEEGVQGARLGILDDNTTGQFTRQTFTLKEHLLPAEGDVATAFRTLVSEGYRLILADLPAARLIELANLPEAANILLLDIASQEDSLRSSQCKSNVLHLLPSHAMRADALAQYLTRKRWHKWFLVMGSDDQDKLYAEAVRKAAKKFGAKIVAEKTWAHVFDDRRTPESEVPVFTQESEHDVVIVADPGLAFGDLLPYRTWSPRPVAGASGLTPVAWHHTHEAWGALQLQNRFRERAGRWMTEKDYGAWLAVRAIGEAATRSQSVEFPAIQSFLLGEKFSLAGFKGVPLSFRHWDRQLRQPVLLAAERSLVAVAPIEGFLHPKNELDTLGADEAESSCRF